MKPFLRGLTPEARVKLPLFHTLPHSGCHRNNISQYAITEKMVASTTSQNALLMLPQIDEDNTGSDSFTVPKYPQVPLVKILGVGCYFRDCEIRTRKVANSLENLQMCSKSCKCVRNLVNTRLMFANTLEKLKMVDMEDDLIHLMVLRRKTPGKYSTAY